MVVDDRLTYWPSSGSVGFVVNGIRVLLSNDVERTSPAEKEALALELLERGSALARQEEAAKLMEQRIAYLESQVVSLRNKLPPEAPMRLFGAGIIRTDEKGFPWVMNKPEPERMWGTTGIRFDSWDDLFRHLDVRILSAEVDQAGPFFRFEVPQKEVPNGGGSQQVDYGAGACAYR